MHPGQLKACFNEIFGVFTGSLPYPNYVNMRRVIISCSFILCFDGVCFLC